MATIASIGRRNSAQRVVMMLLVVALSVGLLEPCTIFTATIEGRTLVGNNEDWEDFPTRVWFLVPQEGAFGRLLFGFINGWVQGGMNDQGLFLDWVAGYTTGWTRSPNLPDFFENISVDGFANILSTCRLKGRFQTRYSNIYDLREGEVHVYDFAGNEHGVVLNLKAELDKGNHYYDVAQIADQLMQAPKVDHKTASAVEISPAAASAISGTYRGSKKTLRAVQITLEDGSLYLRPVAGQTRRFRLYASSEDVFFLRCIAGRFTARRDSDGRITGLLMEQAGHQNILERLEEAE